MNNELKLLKVFFDNPTTKFHLRELARLTSLNPNTIINISKKIENQGLIKSRKQKHLREICANIENTEFIIQKRISNFSQLYNSGLIKFLINKYEPEAVSIIGSYSKGEDIEKSDIDIVVISNKKEIAEIDKYEKILKRKIHLLVLTYNKMSEEFYINLINGIVLYGYIMKK